MPDAEITIDERVDRLESVAARLVKESESQGAFVVANWRTLLASLERIDRDQTVVAARVGELDSKIDALTVRVWQIVALAAASGAFGAASPRLLELLM